jgi:alpha-amylase/alpha-mannosidase (GH57 family)
MPWVRLHATKDYLDMAERVLRRPNLAVTVNVVPSLLEQLAAADAGAGDPEWDLTRAALESLDDEGRATLLTRLSIVPGWARARFPRFAVPRAASSDADLLDLRALHTLAWIDPTLYALPALATVVERAQRGEPLGSEDGAALVAASGTLLSEVVPRLRALAAHPHSEVSVTPYYHPILPLLVDTESARRAMPQVPLPKARFRHPEDARAQLAAARRCAQAVLGHDTIGLWPSEGSVSPEVARLAAEVGYRWLGTDVEVLYRSQGKGIEGAWAHARPWRAGEGGPLFFFRDRELSDKVGFAYSKWPAGDAVADVMARITSLRDQWKGPGPARLFIALDGENCWEYYPDDGHEFIERLYDALEATPWLTTTTPGRVVAETGPRGDVPGVGHIDTLHSGSWIEANYRIWIGHPEKNAAWDALAMTRAMVGDAFGPAAPPDEAFWDGGGPVWGEDLGGPVPESEDERRRQAWRHVMIAEGSDWFWWFGDDHFTADKALFDRLLREHLARAYELAGRDVPQELLTAIASAAVVEVHEEPRAPLAPDISGRLTHYYEWDGAGIWRPAGAGGAMHGGRRIKAIRYGFDDTTLYVRVDVDSPRDGQSLELDFHSPTPAQVLITHGARVDPDAEVQTAWDRLAEIAIPLAKIGARPGERVRWLVLLRDGEHVVECAPEGLPLEVEVPGPDFAARHWSA